MKHFLKIVEAVDVPVMGPGDILQDKCDTASAVTIQPMAGGLFS